MADSDFQSVLKSSKEFWLDQQLRGSERYKFKYSSLQTFQAPTVLHLLAQLVLFIWIPRREMIGEAR